MIPGVHSRGTAGSPASSSSPAIHRASREGTNKPRTNGVFPADHLNGDAVHPSDANANALEVADSLEAQADALCEEDNVLGGIELAAKALQLRCSVIAALSSPEKQTLRSSSRKNQSLDGYSARGSVDQDDVSGAVQAAFAAAEKIVLRCNVTAMERLRSDPNDSVAFSLLSYAHQLTETGKGPLHANPEAHTSLQATTLNNLGCLYERRGDDQTALTLIRSAVEAAPDSAVSLINLSALHNKLGFPLEAARAAREAVRVIDESNSPRSAKSKGAAAQARANAAAAPMALSSVYQAGRRSSVASSSHSLALWRAAAYHNLAMALETLDTGACLDTYERATIIALDSFGVQHPVTQQIIDDMLRYAELHGVTRLLVKYGSARGTHAAGTSNSQEQRHEEAATPSHSQLNNNRSNTFQMQHPVIVLQAQKPAPDVRRRPSATARNSQMTGGSASPPPLRARKQFLAPMPSSRSGSPNSSAQSTPRAITKRGGHAATYSGLRIPLATERKGRKVEPIQSSGAGAATATSSMTAHGRGPLPPLDRGGRTNLCPLPPSPSSVEKPAKSSRVRGEKMQPSSAHGQSTRSEKSGGGDRGAASDANLGQSLPPPSSSSKKQQQSRTASAKKETEKGRPTRSGFPPTNGANQPHPKANSKSDAATGGAATLNKSTQKRNSPSQRTASTPRKPPHAETAKESKESRLGALVSSQEQSTGIEVAEGSASPSSSAAPNAKVASSSASGKKTVKSGADVNASAPHPPPPAKEAKESSTGGNDSRVKNASVAKKRASETDTRLSTSTNASRDTTKPPTAGPTTSKQPNESMTSTSRIPGANGGVEDIVHALVDRLRMLISDEAEYCRQSVFAERIQRAYRCHLARKDLQRRKDEQKATATLSVLRTHIAATIAQRAFRAYLAREKTHKEHSRLAAQRADIENYSATQIQSVARRWLARRELRRRRQFSSRVTRAASALQRWFRVCLAKERVRELRDAHAREQANLIALEKQELAALVLQRAWRAHFSRKSTRRNRSAMREKRHRLEEMRRHAGSLAIQRLWRGRRARQGCSAYKAHVLLYRDKLEAVERRDGAATRLQSWFRMLREERRHRAARADLRLARLLAEEERSPRRLAAECIQRAVRQFLARAQLRRLKDGHNAKKNARRGERFAWLWQRVGRGFLARKAVRAAFRNQISQGLLHAAELDHVELLERHARGVAFLRDAYRVASQETEARGDVAKSEETARNALGKTGLADLEVLLQIERDAKRRAYEEENGVARSQWKQRKKFWMEMLPARAGVQERLLRGHRDGCEAVLKQWTREKDALELKALDAEWETQIRAAQDEERALLEEVLAARREARVKEREAENERHAQRLHISEQRALFRGKMLLQAKRLGSMDGDEILERDDDSMSEARRREGALDMLAASYTPSDGDWSFRVSQRHAKDPKVRHAALLVTRVGRGFVGRLVFRAYRGIMASYNEERVSSEATRPPIPYILDNFKRHSAGVFPRHEEAVDFTALPEQVQVLAVDTPPVNPAHLEQLLEAPQREREPKRVLTSAPPVASWSLSSVHSEPPGTDSDAGPAEAENAVDDSARESAADRIRCFLRYIPSSKREVDARQRAVREHLGTLHDEVERSYQREEEEQQQKEAERQAEEVRHNSLLQAAKEGKARETLGGFTSIIRSRQNLSDKQAALLAYLQEEHAKEVLACFARSCLSRSEAEKRRNMVEQHISAMEAEDASAIRIQCAYRQRAARTTRDAQLAAIAEQIEIEHAVNEVLHESACAIQRGFRCYYARQQAEGRRAARNEAYERLAAVAQAAADEEEEEDDTYGTETGEFTSATSITYDESSIASGLPRNNYSSGGSAAFSSPSRGNSSSAYRRGGSASKQVEADRKYLATMLSVSEDGKNALAGFTAEETLHCVQMLQDSARVIQQSARRWLAKRKLSNLRHQRQEHLARLRSSSLHDDADAECSTSDYYNNDTNINNETTEDAESTGDFYDSSTGDEITTGADEDYAEEEYDEDEEDGEEEVEADSNEFEDEL